MREFTAAQAAQKVRARNLRGLLGFTAAQAAQKRNQSRHRSHGMFTAAQAAQKNWLDGTSKIDRRTALACAALAAGLVPWAFKTAVEIPEKVVRL